MTQLDPNLLPVICIADEAGNQPYEGKVAVGVVIMNRWKTPYASDGSLEGTVLHKWAFSGFWAQMEHGKYTQIEFDLAGAETQAAQLQQEFQAQSSLWHLCTAAWADAQAWAAGTEMSFTPGPNFKQLTHKTVLYYNPKIIPTPPAWAIPSKFAAKIYDETFYNM